MVRKFTSRECWATFLLLVFSLLNIPDILSAKSPSAAPMVFSVSGTITDSKTKEPVAGAVVRLGKDYLWALSDDKGHFLFEKVQRGRYQVETSCLGYVSYTLVLDVSSDIEGLSIALSESTLAIDEVVEKMSEYSYSGEAARLFGKLRNAAAEGDTDVCAEVVASWKILLGE